MGPTEWTIIGVGVALFVALGSLIRFSNSTTKNELKADIANVRIEIADLRTELKGDIAELRTELKGDIAELRTELKGDIAELRTELKGDIASLKLDIQANRNEIVTNRRMLGRFSLHRHGDDGLPLAPLTDSLDPPEGAGSSEGDDN